MVHVPRYDEADTSFRFVHQSDATTPLLHQSHATAPLHSSISTGPAGENPPAWRLATSGELRPAMNRTATSALVPVQNAVTVKNSTSPPRQGLHSRRRSRHSIC
jgi:hypothetical protein